MHAQLIGTMINMDIIGNHIGSELNKPNKQGANILYQGVKCREYYYKGNQYSFEMNFMVQVLMPEGKEPYRYYPIEVTFYNHMFELGLTDITRREIKAHCKKEIERIEGRLIRMGVIDKHISANMVEI
jgi:hypothetical protein